MQVAQFRGVTNITLVVVQFGNSLSISLVDPLSIFVAQKYREWEREPIKRYYTRNLAVTRWIKMSQPSRCLWIFTSYFFFFFFMELRCEKWNGWFFHTIYLHMYEILCVCDCSFFFFFFFLQQKFARLCVAWNRSDGNFISVRLGARTTFFFFYFLLCIAPTFSDNVALLVYALSIRPIKYPIFFVGLCVYCTNRTKRKLGLK